jgi:dipeptidyl-peptidase-4
MVMKMKATKRGVLGCAVIGLVLLAVAPLPAQQAVDAQMRRIFASRDFASERFGPARWLDGGTYTTVEAAQGGGFEIVRYDAASGARSVYVSAKQLTPAGEPTPLGISDYIWSADGNKLLIFTNTARVWRDNTRGDYWVLDRTNGQLRKLGGNGPASTMMFAKFTPDGSRVGYVREGDIYVEDVASGSITRLTSNASRTIVNGTTDWVYEEEFYLRDAFRFSPDGQKVAYWQFDMSGVRDFLMINNTDSTYSYTIPIQYPKAGTTNSAVRAGVVSARGGATTWIDLPGDPRDDYLPRMEWAGNSNELVLQRVNRLQNTNRVLIADAATGRTRELTTERDSAWLDVIDFHWLDPQHMLWISERSGWRQLYSISRDGKSTKVLTPGTYDVITGRRGGTGVDIAGGHIYFAASPENATQRYLYRVPIGGGKAQRITPANAAGSHSYSIAPGGRFALHTYSSFDSPPVVDLVELPTHKSVRTLVTNEHLRAAVQPLISRPAEFFKVKVGEGVELDGWMLFPRDFNPTRKYPMIMHVYSEPASQTVQDSWGGSQMLWHRMLADQGYIVASVDNRGTPAPKGRAWRKVVYGQIGILSSKEQADAVRALAAQRAYIDASRVGIWGWSGGGSATLNAMFRYPDVYRVGVSVAPVPDEKLYDTVYQERYMGLPQQNVEGYRLGSPITHAEGLRGDLLIIHGTGDDNVHIQGTERLVNRLITLNKKFDYMAYPNRSHCICEGAGTTLHIQSLITRFLLEKLPANPRLMQ